MRKASRIGHQLQLSGFGELGFQDKVQANSGSAAALCITGMKAPYHVRNDEETRDNRDELFPETGEKADKLHDE